MPEMRAPEVAAEALLGGGDVEQTIATYEEVGAVVVRGLIRPEWLAELRACYDTMAEAAWSPFGRDKTKPGARQIVNRHRMWEDEPPFRAFLFDSGIARAAALLMRSTTATLYEDILLTEPAGQQAMLSWHQDEPTWPVEGGMMSSVWLSLEPVDAETGAIRFVRGSHRGPMFHPKHVRTEDVGDDTRFWTGGAFPDDASIGGETVVIAPTSPGDAVIFHPRAIHTAYGSSPDHARRSFTIRFLGDDVRWCPKQRIFHRWMHDLPLSAGDRVVSPRLPLVWDGARAA